MCSVVLKCLESQSHHQKVVYIIYFIYLCEKRNEYYGYYG